MSSYFESFRRACFRRAFREYLWSFQRAFVEPIFGEPTFGNWSSSTACNFWHTYPGLRTETIWYCVCVSLLTTTNGLVSRIWKKTMFVKICKYAFSESSEGFCCGTRKPANPCHPVMRHYKSSKLPFFLFLYSPLPKQVLNIVTIWSMPLRQQFKHNNYHVTERTHVPRHSCFPVHVLFVVKADAVTRQPWPLPLLYALRIWLIS